MFRIIVTHLVTCYCNTTFAFMLERKRTALRTQLIVGYSEVLTSVRRSVKGIRIAYLFNIQIVGENNGLRLCEICEITGRNKCNVWESMDRVIKAGYIYKENKRYYLTDSGRTAYNAICKQFDATIEEIIRELVREAAGRVK